MAKHSQAQGFTLGNAFLTSGTWMGDRDFGTWFPGEWLCPGGTDDRSQARSAWIGIPSGPRPGGTVEVIVSPTEICRLNRGGAFRDKPLGTQVA
jgi:hypothetical protein